MLFIAFCLLPLCLAHMSMDFPRHRDTDVNGNDYAQWKLNEPMWPARKFVCHGLPARAVPAQNQFTANQVINVELYNNVPHAGGHCSFWYSTDDIEFVKISDVKDCTLLFTSGSSIPVQLPDTMAAECGTRCTFAWTWVPRVSGACEIYSNCADIQVTGLSGQAPVNPHVQKFQDWIDNEECQRVDDNTHWSSIMGPLQIQTFSPTNALPSPLPTPRPPTQPIPSPVPAPTATGSANGITFTNFGTVSKWWYAARLNNVADGFSIEYVEVESQGVWYYCTPDNSAGSYTVYGCQPGNDGFNLPLGVRVVSNKGEMISASGVVLNWNSNAVFHSGVNFVGLGHTSTTTTTRAATSTTSSTSTTNAATTSTTNAGTTTTSTSKSNIIVVTRPSTSWFYSCEVQNVASGVVITDFKLKYNGIVVSCSNGGFTGKLVFQCSPPQALAFPLDVEITGNGQTLNAPNVILSLDADRAYDLGVQFSSGTVTPSTTALPPTSSTLVSSTFSTSSSSSSTATSSVAPTTTTSTTRSSSSASSTSTSSSAAPSTSTISTNNGRKEIIGYYAAWQWYDREKLAQPLNMDFSKLTIVNFAFFQPDTLGNLYGTDEWADPQVLFGPIDWNGNGEFKCHLKAPNTQDCNYHQVEQGLIHLVHQAGAKIFPSIGGWTLSDNFPVLAASAQARQNFAAQCVKLIQDYGFDGIDIDWEYPGYADHSGTAADTVNFNLLLQEVRSALDALSSQTGQYYQITAALPCGPSIIDNIDVSTVATLLDQLNLMTYDFFGSWDATTGVNAPLYAPNGVSAEKQDFNVDSCVANWKAAGATDDKINIGLPFYGRSFAGAKGLNQPHSRADTANWPDDEGVPQYFNIEAKLDSMTVVRDEQSKTQFAYFADGGFVSFDDQQAICDKVEYAIVNGLNGFIIWELSGDLRADLSTPLLDEVHMKLDYPNTHSCGGASNARLVENQVAVDSLEQKQQESSSCLVCFSVSLFLLQITWLFV